MKNWVRFPEKRGNRLSLADAARRNSASGEEGEGSEGEALIDLESGTPHARTHTITSDRELVDVSVPETPGPKSTSVPAQEWL
jgi:hypothetical protein